MNFHPPFSERQRSVKVYGTISARSNDPKFQKVQKSLVKGIITSGNHGLESAGLNALEELLRCWEWTEKIVKPACVF